MADDEGRTDPDELEEQGLELDSVAVEYWVSEARWLFFSAFYSVDDSVRESEALRSFAEGSMPSTTATHTCPRSSSGPARNQYPLQRRFPPTSRSGRRKRG